MKFSKHLGPTARTVAHRMLLGRGLDFQARHQPQPLLRSSNAQSCPRPRFLDVASINGSLRNTNTNQVSQQLICFQGSSSNLAADYKGKKIMVDDGRNNSNKWPFGDNLEFLFGKRKDGGKIYHGAPENMSLATGDGLTQDKDFVNKNLAYGQVGNQRIVNQFGPFPLNYNGILNHNTNKITGNEGVRVVKEGFWNLPEASSRNGKQNSRVYPSTYLPPSRKDSSSFLGLGGGVSPIPQIQPPSEHSRQPAQPMQNWRLPPPTTNNKMVWQEQELKLALASYMQPADQESNVGLQNSWAQTQPNQFLQPYTHGAGRQQPNNKQPQQHQVLSYQNLLGNNASQQQDRFLMSMPPHPWSQMAMLGTTTEQDSLSFGKQNYGVQMQNILQPPPSPPGI